MSVTIRRDGRAAIVELTNPPVNAIGQEMRQGLLDAVAWAEAEEGLDRVIVTGAGRAFAAGADAREFDAAPQEPHLPDVLAAIEASRVPWIAAVNGVALGGGCEIVLACRYRVAAPAAQLGLPEVTLGVVPGAGGTQRLPRLIGLAPALEMIAGGKVVTAARALDLRLVNELSDDPVSAAAELPVEALDTAVAVSDLPGPEEDADVFSTALARAARKTPGQEAPRAAIDLVRLSCTTPFAEAMQAERRTFLERRNSDQGRALRHIFFAERGARPPARLADVTSAPLDHVAVVGGGTMGAGIAYALLNAGLRVTLLETDAEAVVRARANVDKIVEASQARGLISHEEASDRRARITCTADYAGAADAALAIEAAFESMEVKKDVFTRLQAALPGDAVLATNTSYLDVNEIAAQVADPSRVLGLHFFAPAHIMRLLEIVEGAQSSDRALATGYALAKRLRKVPVLAGVCDGFIGNRILNRYREAADTLLMDGSNPWEIDEAMEEFGYALGLYATQDLSGLDISHANRRRQDATRDPNRRYIPIADRMVNEGRLGRKTGVGWYRYPGGGGRVIDPLVEDLCREEAHFAGVTRVDYTPEEIRHRLLLAMINEAAAILGEGIAQSAADIDLVTVFGYGFPRWRGGLMHYADTLGAQTVLEGLQVLCDEDPLVWQPCEVVVHCARTGTPFARYRR